MGVFLGVYFDKIKLTYCSISLRCDRSYIVHTLFSSSYQIIEQNYFEKYFIKCNESHSRKISTSEKISSHFEIDTPPLYFHFYDKNNYQENDFFIPRKYKSLDLEKLIYNRIFNLYSNLYDNASVKYSLSLIDINIDNFVILKESNDYLQLKVNFEFWAKPHPFGNYLYHFQEIEDIKNFLLNVMKIPQERLDLLKINIIDKF